MADKDEQRLLGELCATVAGALKGKDAAAFLADRIESIKKTIAAGRRPRLRQGLRPLLLPVRGGLTPLEIFRLAERIEKGALFEDAEVVGEWQRFFLEACGAKGIHAPSNLETG